MPYATRTSICISIFQVRDVQRAAGTVQAWLGERVAAAAAAIDGSRAVSSPRDAGSSETPVAPEPPYLLNGGDRVDWVLQALPSVEAVSIQHPHSFVVRPLCSDLTPLLPADRMR
jgi:hypothetical protein